MSDERNPKFEGVLGEELDRIWKAIRQDKINSSPSVKATRTPTGTVLSGKRGAPASVDVVTTTTWGFSKRMPVHQHGFPTKQLLITEVEEFAGDPVHQRFTGRTKKVLTLKLPDVVSTYPDPHAYTWSSILFPKLTTLMSYYPFPRYFRWMLGSGPPNPLNYYDLGFYPEGGITKLEPLRDIIPVGVGPFMDNPYSEPITHYIHSIRDPLLGFETKWWGINT